MVLSKKRARHVIEEIIALFPDAKPSLDFRNHFELFGCGDVVSSDDRCGSKQGDSSSF